jgi:hypothetical protein
MRAAPASPNPSARLIARLCLWLAGCALAGAAEPATAPAPTVTLDKLVVTTTQDYRPLEDGWQVGGVPGFLIFSHGNAAFKTVAEQLQLARAAFALVWKDEALVKRLVTVVVTADEPEFLAWAKLPPVTMDKTVRVVATPAGTVLLVNGGNDAVHRAVGRGYVLALLQETKSPRWLQEGIAQVVNSAEATGDRLQVGRVQQDERNLLSLQSLREVDGFARMAATPGASRLEPIGPIVNTRGDAVEVRLNGLIPTQQELEQHLDGELQRRVDQRHVYTPTDDFFTYLADGVAMPLGKVFDPEAPDTVAWRMNAWGFTHYSLFADKQRHQPAFRKFVQQLEREPGRAPVEVLKDAYGQSAGKLELNLTLYARNADYAIFDFKLAEPFAAVKPAMIATAEANVLQLRARVLNATDRNGEARQLLARGYANPANRTPSYVSQFVGLERRHDPARAAELLEDAARHEQLDNTSRRMLAEARLERLQRGGARLAPDDLRMVLLPLFAALNEGDESEELFVLIGRAWAASAVPPKPEHLNALRMGLSIHPNSRPLAELLKQLEHS